jgi:5S rRNA maturation endonuclease (ribonuclease M5)
MAFSKGNTTITLEDILDKTTESDILNCYLGVRNIPCVINSPLREDKRPSFGIYSNDGHKIYWKDYGTGEKGGLIDLLSLLWSIPYSKVLERIWRDINKLENSNLKPKQKLKLKTLKDHKSTITLKCKVREWRDYDLKYWQSYGISKKWLEYANVYPISHKIVIKDGKQYVFGADKYAYAFVEFKEGNTSIKIYQPYNTQGFKWSSGHDGSVISLWTKIPKEGDKVCICASLKDALCLSANTNIPAIALQGEGYVLSNTAITELKKRFKEIYILFDNDKEGLKDGKKLAELTGFTNLILPLEYGEKDISDYYKSLWDKKEFTANILKLFTANDCREKSRE